MRASASHFDGRYVNAWPGFDHDGDKGGMGMKALLTAAILSVVCTGCTISTPTYPFGRAKMIELVRTMKNASQAMCHNALIYEASVKYMANGQVSGNWQIYVDNALKSLKNIRNAFKMLHNTSLYISQNELDGGDLNEQRDLIDGMIHFDAVLDAEIITLEEMADGEIEWNLYSPVNVAEASFLSDEFCSLNSDLSRKFPDSILR